MRFAEHRLKILLNAERGDSLTVNQLRQYRKNKGRKLLLESELKEEKSDKEIKRLENQISVLNTALTEVEEYIKNVDDSYISEMLEAHYIHGTSWANIAYYMGGGNTNESVRKQCHRYIKKS